MKNALNILLGACALVVLTGCQAFESEEDYLGGFKESHKTNAEDNVIQVKGYWDDSGIKGSALIRINLRKQRAYFYKGGALVGSSPISTGTEGRRTPKGRYKVTQKDEDHESSLYGIIRNKSTGKIVNDDADTRKHKAGPGEVFELAPMPYFLRFNGGVGMHTGFLPGYPASHGCIRLPNEMAAIFFKNASLGTPVIVE